MTGPAARARLAESLVCPACRGPLRRDDDATLRCAAEATTYRRIDGIWRLLDPVAREVAERFVDHYRTVRRAEGWGAADDAYYRSLPFEDLSGRHPEIWKIRARSYRAFVRRVLPRSPPRHRVILDLGAGNGWLARRMAGRGHDVAAVDINLDERDGLGAHVHYGGPPFLVVQAAFDRLPWSDDLVDLVVFNGSFHYSADYTVTLGEARRVLRPGGEIVLLDTPFYRRQESGAAMVRERDERIGPACDDVEGLDNEGFLTRARLEQLGDELGIEWQLDTPWYGPRWALRPLLNRIRGDREPARFHLVRGRINAG